MFSSFLGRGFNRSGRPAQEKNEAVRPVESSSKKPTGPAQKGVSRSRSTSVGSSATTSERLQDALSQTRSPPVEEQPPQREAIPDITYPVPFVIRNTFVDVPVGRPVSLDEFMEERKTNSCPPSAIGLPPGLPASEVLSEHEGVLLDTFLSTAVKKTPRGAQLPRSPQVPRCSSLLTVPPMDYHPQHISTPFNSDEYPAASIDFMSTGARGPRTFQPMPQPPPPPQWVPNLQEAVVPPPPSATAEQACKGTLLATLSPAEVPRQGQILQLAKALPEPELGSPECPTMGSRGHALGNCKPCAFVHTKGCENGTQCIFCHLCEPGEKKRRAKEKKERRRETRSTWSLF